MSQHIEVDCTSMRIDKYLVEKLSVSRNFIHRLLQLGSITVRNRRGEFLPKKSYKTSHGDAIEVTSLERCTDPGILEECTKRDIQVIHETDDYMVIYKPKGVLSHPNSVWDVTYPSVVGGVYHYIQQKKISLPTSGSFVRSGLVHRLDKETDGLMIIALSERGLEHFSSLFRRKSEQSTIEGMHTVPLKKVYSCTCETTPQGRDFIGGIDQQLPYIIDKIVVPQVPHSIPKRGLTKILEINETNDNEIAFVLEILTGRTHQIRYHLSSEGVPIVGDYIYGNESKRGLLLSAIGLEFEDPDGEYKKFLYPICS